MARITLLNQFYVPDISPTAHLSASLAEHLASEGHEVTVITSRGGYTGAQASEVGDQKSEVKSRKPHLRSDDEDADGASIRVHRIWTPRLGKATHLKRLIDYACFYLGALWRCITLPRQDVTISLTTPPYIALAAAAHTLLHRSSKLVLWSMDCYPDAAERMEVIRRGGLTSRFMRRLNRVLFARLDHLIVLDTAMRDLLISQYAPRRRALPVTVIPNWEKADLFEPAAAPPRWEGVERLGLAGRFVVLYLGNTGYGHHFDSVLDAAAELRDEPVTFLFIGGGRRWDEIEQGVRSRGLSNVIMHSYVPKDQTPSVMAAADCALITLRDNSLGVMSPSKLHSNLAMSLPVIYLGPELSNVDDAIRNYGCGVSLRSDDSQGVVRFIREHLDRGDAFAKLRTQARHAFDSAYVDTRTLPQFSRLVESLIAGASIPRPRVEAEGGAVQRS